MRHVLLYLFLVSSVYLSAQLNGKYPFRHLDQTDGLLNTFVRGISQDKRGFIWILSTNGLQRYDGTRFLNYPQITNQSAFGVVHDAELYMDTAANFIWIIKGQDIQQLDLTSNSFSETTLKSFLKNNPTFPTLPFKDWNNQNWWISEAGLSRIINSDTNYNPNYHPGQSHRSNYILRDPVTGNFLTHNFDKLIIAEKATGLIRTSIDQQIQDPLLQQWKEKLGNKIAIRYLLFDSFNNF